MKKYILTAMIAAIFTTSSVYAHSQSTNETSETTETVTSTKEKDTTTDDLKSDNSSESSKTSSNQKSTSSTEATESAREQYDGIGGNINYTDPSNKNYVAPPIFPFPDAYTLRLPSKITVEDVQIHPPILPYPHRMQYEVQKNISGENR